jgi:hypothetical protein
MQQSFLLIVISRASQREGTVPFDVCGYRFPPFSAVSGSRTIPSAPVRRRALCPISPVKSSIPASRVRPSTLPGTANPSSPCATVTTMKEKSGASPSSWWSTSAIGRKSQAGCRIIGRSGSGFPTTTPG